MCFLIFRNRSASRYLFSAEDLTCVYNYTLSGIVNAIVVITMLTYEEFEAKFRESTFSKKAIFVILLYLGSFSHLFHSEMIGIFCALRIIFFVRSHKNINENKLIIFIKKNYIYVLGLAFWICAMLFELTGGRGKTVSKGANLTILLPLRQLVTMLSAISIPFKILILIGIIGIIRTSVRRNLSMECKRILFELIANGMIVLLFLILLCSVIGYMSRIEASWCIWFYLILLTLLGMSLLVVNSDVNCIKIFAVGTIFLIIAVYYPDGKYRISTVNGIDYETCVKVDRMLYDQIVEASEAAEYDEDKIYTIITPQFKDENLRWAMPNDNVEGQIGTLYKHGIIKRKFNSVTQEDYSLLQ